jgi:hypothetical protein
MDHLAIVRLAAGRIGCHFVLVAQINRAVVFGQDEHICGRSF